MTLSTAEQKIVDGIPNALYIDGKWRPATEGGTFAVDDPATGEEFARVADATPADAMAALDAACAAQESWAATAPRERGEILRRAYEKLVARSDELAVLMTLEMGKPVAESRGEIVYGAEFLRWFAEEAVRVAGRFGSAPAGTPGSSSLKKPLGPCVLVTPWNFPLAMATRKVGPAIAAGCTMVLKPAALTPLTALAFTQVLEEAGLPAGVLNLVTTKKAGAAIGPLLADPRSRKISFTGSTEVGKQLMVQASATVMRTSMELGGNAPFLVFADADVDAAVDGAMLAKMRNGGEACTAANRFHVHVDVAQEFSRKLAARMAAVVTGRGTEAGVGLGPMVDEASQLKVAELVDDAVALGATVLTGGTKPEGPGWFYPATVLADVPATARILKEEVFGPVAPITTFSTVEEAVAQANDTEFGLVSYAYTRDLALGLKLPELLETGMLGLNRGLVSNPAAPFGGVKESGVGREGGLEGVGEYLDTLYVSLPA